MGTFGVKRASDEYFCPGTVERLCMCYSSVRSAATNVAVSSRSRLLILILVVPS